MSDTELNTNRKLRQRVKELESFDGWEEHPYTKVLQKSIADDYVPRTEYAAECLRLNNGWMEANGTVLDRDLELATLKQAQGEPEMYIAHAALKMFRETGFVHAELTSRKGGVPLYLSAPTIQAGKTAKEQFNELFGELEEEPIERLRFFCSLALNSQDWLDVEPFFDDLLSAAPKPGEAA